MDPPVCFHVPPEAGSDARSRSRSRSQTRSVPDCTRRSPPVPCPILLLGSHTIHLNGSNDQDFQDPNQKSTLGSPWSMPVEFLSSALAARAALVQGPQQVGMTT